MSKSARLTLKLLADELGLSTCTVSRVLNGKGQQYRIAKRTQKRVVEHARQRGFSPNLVARGLRMKKTHTVGLVLPDLSNPFFAKIARSVAEETHKNKYTLEVCDSQDSTDLEIDALRLLRDRQVDGLILGPVGNESEHLVSLTSGSQPVILVDRYFSDLKLPYVTSDNFGAGEMATRHLLRYGHRKIACAQGLPNTVTNVRRLEGFRHAMRAHKARIVKKMIIGNAFTRESGYQATRMLLEQNCDFTALLAFSNQIALGALRALSEAGVEVPQDVSLVAFDSIEGVEFFATPLTTVAQPVREIGARAASMLFDGILDRVDHTDEHLLLPTKLISRKSVKRICSESGYGL